MPIRKKSTVTTWPKKKRRKQKLVKKAKRERVVRDKPKLDVCGREDCENGAGLNRARSGQLSRTVSGSGTEATMFDD